MQSFKVYLFSYLVVLGVVLFLPVVLINWLSHVPVDFFGWSLRGRNAFWVTVFVYIAVCAGVSAANWGIMKIANSLYNFIKWDRKSFKFQFIAYVTVAVVPVIFLLDALSFFHVAVWSFNGHHVYKWRAVIWSLFFIPFIGAYFAGLNWVVVTLGTKVLDFFWRRLSERIRRSEPIGRRPRRNKSSASSSGLGARRVG